MFYLLFLGANIFKLGAFANSNTKVRKEEISIIASINLVLSFWDLVVTLNKLRDFLLTIKHYFTQMQLALCPLEVMTGGIDLIVHIACQIIRKKPHPHDKGHKWSRNVKGFQL